MAKFRSGVDSAPSEPPRSLLEDLRMSTVPVVEDDSYLGTKRWFKKYPELGDPGIPVPYRRRRPRGHLGSVNASGRAFG